VPNFVSFAACTAELAHGEKLHSQSLTHPAYLVRQYVSTIAQCRADWLLSSATSHIIATDHAFTICCWQSVTSQQLIDFNMLTTYIHCLEIQTNFLKSLIRFGLSNYQ